MSTESKSKNGNNFKTSLLVKEPPHLVDHYSNFLDIYNSFIEYLTNIDFSCLKPPKATKANYKSRNKQNNLNENIKKLDNYLPTIEDYLIQLSQPQYLQFLNELAIPDRTNASMLTSDQQQEEEYKIRLQYYIRELVNSYQAIFNPDIRTNYINLSTYILREYSNSQPSFGRNTIHFRFKATKGLIIKLAKKILFERFFF